MADNVSTESESDKQSQESATPAWATDLSKVDSEEWFTRLPEDIRPTVRSGLESRLQDYDRGYQSKFQSLANDRKSWESEKTEMERNSKLFSELFSGNEDPRVAESAQKLADLEKKLAELTAERDGYKTKWDSHEKEEIEREADRVIEKFKDVIDYKVKGKDGKETLPAWDKFVGLS